MVVVLERVNMVVAASIGLVAESINRHKQNAQAQQPQSMQFLSITSTELIIKR